MNGTTWTQCWRELCLAYRRTEQDGESDLYFQHLERFPDDVVCEAVTAAIASELYPPNVALLVERCSEVVKARRRVIHHVEPDPPADTGRLYRCANCLDTGMIDITVPHGKHLVVGGDGRLRFADPKATTVTFYSNTRLRCSCDRGLARPEVAGQIFSPIRMRALGWFCNRRYSHLNAIHGFRVPTSAADYITWAEEQVGRAMPGGVSTARASTAMTPERRTAIEVGEPDPDYTGDPW